MDMNYGVRFFQPISSQFVDGVARREERAPDGIALSDKMTVVLPAVEQSQFVDAIARP